ncbi:hypothetical protein N9998_00280 [Nitrosopumilus sp.]|nr:hypothetical protein [Nitrosopumilus sp.]
MINMKDMKDMPAIPDLFYRAEWKGWDDFLNTQYPYDWELVEIIKFNYDGLGGAIALCDGRTTYIHSIDLNNILFGNQYGSVHYDTVAIDDNRIVLRQSEQAKKSLVTAPKTKPKKTKKSSKNVRKKKTKK